MAIISIFSGSYCRAEEIAEKSSGRLGYELLGTDNLTGGASKQFSTTREKLLRAMHGAPTFLNNITHEKEKNIAFLRHSIATIVEGDNVVYEGFAALLLPMDVAHILRVYIIADHAYRINEAARLESISEKEAHRRIRINDRESVRWTYYLFGKAPWEESLYDIIIPMHSTSVDKAVDIICENAGHETLRTTASSQRALEDFIIAQSVNIALIKKGYFHEVRCHEGNITILVNEYMINLEQHEHNLTEIAASIPGVKKVEARLGSHACPHVFGDIDIDVPPKVLLVDDEAVYVQTLSERLKCKKIESSIAYDGGEALSIAGREQPEVMILDLKMPGIDGFEVLRKMREDHPETRVIVVTGQTSEEDRAKAIELGAFAYLEKPVDMEKLTEIMNEASREIRKQRDKTKEDQP